MSHSVEAVRSAAESDAGPSEITEVSLSRRSSCSSLVTNDLKSEKILECLSSSKSGWTDSKHNSYLDFMEANFVQNMFARCYCMEDVCGGTACHHHHHHHQQHQHQHQHDSQLYYEETDDSTAESQPHLQAPEWEMHDRGKWTCSSALKNRAPGGVRRGLLGNPWFKHFQARSVLTAGIKTNDGKAKGDGQCQKTAFLIIHKVVPCHSTSDSLSGSEKAPAAPLGRIVDLKATILKDRFPNVPSNDLNKNDSRNKRRILWSAYKQLRRTRQKTENYVGDCNMSS